MATPQLAVALSLILVLWTGREQQTQTGAITPLKKLLFSKSADGLKIGLFSLMNRNGVEIGIMNRGGAVALGFDSLDGCLKDNPFFGALVGRFGNRTARAGSNWTVSFTDRRSLTAKTT